MPRKVGTFGQIRENLGQFGDDSLPKSIGAAAGRVKRENSDLIGAYFEAKAGLRRGAGR